MVDMDRGREGGEFRWPKGARWGLEPDEQVALFGNPLELDKYSSEARSVFDEKLRLAAKYLASFIPDSGAPEAWKREYREALAARQDSAAGSPKEAFGIFPTSPQEFVLLQYMLNPYRDGAIGNPFAKNQNNGEALDYALALSVVRGTTDTSGVYESYIKQLIIRKATGNWSEAGYSGVVLPESPWKVSPAQYPLGDVLNRELYGEEWQTNGKELFDPKTQQWGLTPSEQIALFGDPPALQYQESATIQEIADMKGCLALKYLAHFLPKTPEWTTRLKGMQYMDALNAAQKIKAAAVDEPTTITLDAPGVRLLGDDVVGWQGPIGEGRYLVSKGSYQLALEGSRKPSGGQQELEQAEIRARYVDDLIYYVYVDEDASGGLPEAPYHVLSQQWKNVKLRNPLTM